MSMTDMAAAPMADGKTSLTQKAYTILRRDMLNWTMPPGTEVSEAALSEQLQMSKTPVREALAQLRSEGFVETYPRRGYRVLPLTLADMNELLEVRTLVEAEAAALAAERGSEADFATLDRLADVTYTLDSGDSLTAFIDANRDFHAAIARSTGNSRLYQLTLAQLDSLERFFYLGALSRDLNPETKSDHHRIVDILRTRHADDARRVLREHNSMTRDGLMDLIANSRSRHVAL